MGVPARAPSAAVAPAVARAAALAVAAALLASLPGAGAFDSLPPGRSVHERITAEGARAAGFPQEAVADLGRAVIAPDLDEMEWAPDQDALGRIDAAKGYRPEHHCDRVPPTTHRQAFDATVAYSRQQLDEAAQTLRLGDADAALAALGRALHAAQDCASHSNAVDLGADAEEAVLQALAGNGSAGLPEGLLVTGFQPGADDPERPPGDAWPHGEHARDSAGSSPDATRQLADGRTAFEASADLGGDVTRLLLRQWLAGLGPGEREALAKAEHGGPALGVGLPAVSPALVVGGLLGGAALLSARGRRR